MNRRIQSILQSDDRIRRICLIKPSALGDVVQTLPLLPVLRARFPAARISWVINSGIAEVLDGNESLDDVIPFQRRGSWGSWLQLLGGLRRSRFDLVLDLQGLLRTGVMTWSTGAPVRIGLETSREGSGAACHFLLPDSGRQVPAHERYWRVAEFLGMGEHRRDVDWNFSPSEISVVERIKAKFRRPLMAVLPGARWETKRWPPEKFAAICARAAAKQGYGIVFLGSRDEREIAERAAAEVVRLNPQAMVENLAGQTTIRQLAVILRGSELLLTNDSGPMHLGASVGTPVLGIFTCTSPILSGPPGDIHELVASQVPCAASYKKNCPLGSCSKMICHEELEVERVWKAFLRLSNKLPLARRFAS